MIKITKDIISSITTPEEIQQNARVVDDSYVLNVTEEQVNSVLVAYVLYNAGRMDFLQYRDYIKYQIVTDTTIQNAQTDQEKNAAYEVFQKPSQVNQNDIKTNEELEKIQINLVCQATQCRKDRILLASAKISFVLDQYASFKLNEDVTEMMYTQITSANPRLLYQLKSEANQSLGIDYTSTGFASKSYYNETAKQIALSILEK